MRLANLLDKDPLFEKFITAPRVLAGITHVIGTEIQLSSLSSRAALHSDALADCLTDHLDQISLSCRAGSVVVFNSHLWHGGRANRTQALPRGVLSDFVRRGGAYSRMTTESCSVRRLRRAYPQQH